MLENVLYATLTANIDIPILPIGPSSDTTVNVANTQPVPSIIYLRHATTPELDLSGTVQCENIDMEIIILGSTFEESTFYASAVETLLSNQAYSGYYFSYFNAMTIPTTFAIAQYWRVFYTAID